MWPSASVTGVRPKDKRWEPSDTERRGLLARAGFQCAICRQEFQTVEKPSKKGILETRHVAQAAHMYPHSDRGERGTPGSRPLLVDDVSNIIMLCPNCHVWADYEGVGGNEFPLAKLQVIKREQEAWVAFMGPRTSVAKHLAKVGQAGLSGVKPGQSVSVLEKNYRLPLDDRTGRVDTTFLQEWSPEGDAMLTRSYAYAETGAAGHAWVRRIDELGTSPAADRWRRELTDEASLLIRLPHLPGLPRVLGFCPLAREPSTYVTTFTLVTTLPSAVCLLDRYGVSADLRPPWPGGTPRQGVGSRAPVRAADALRGARRPARRTAGPR